MFGPWDTLSKNSSHSHRHGVLGYLPPGELKPLARANQVLKQLLVVELCLSRNADLISLA